MGQIVQNVGYTLAIINPIGCLKHTLNQPIKDVTNRKHKKHFVALIALHMRPISPQQTPQQGGHNGLHMVQRKDSIFGCIKNFLQFLAILHKKHYKI